MKYFSLSSFFVILFVFIFNGVAAQLTITMDHPDANYNVGETVHFQVHSTISGTANYTINRGLNTNNITSGSVQLNAGGVTEVTILGGEPENLHFSVSTGWAGAVATAIVGVDEMIPFESEPGDFDSYWNGVKAQLAQVPMNAQVNPYNSTSYSTSYTVSLGNIDGRNVYGMLTVPKGQGPFPVVLEMPPYGSFPIQPQTQFAERANAITLSITIHNAPVTQTDPNAYSPNDPTNRDLIYHKHSITAGIRAIDYLTSRPDFNGTDVVLTGVSQGAGLGLLIAGIDNRVKLLAIGTPTMASHAGMLHDHPSGFPFYLRLPMQNNDPQEIAAVLNATKYYEAASAAKRYHGNVFLLTSYNDDVTIPETQFIATNFFDGKKVILHNIPGGHDNRPEEYLFGRFNYLRRYFPASNNPPFPWSSTDKGYMADVGADKTATVGVPLALSASIVDNTTTNPGIPVKWRKVSGPGNVNFSSQNSYNTNATFSQNGTYVLEFKGKDTGLLVSKKLFYTISDRVVVTVGGGSGNPIPTVVLSTPNTNVTGAFQVTATFSESVTGMTVSDFVVNNGTVSNLSGSGSTYSFTVTPTNNGQVTIQLPAGQVFDSANQGNAASNTLSVQYSVISTQTIDLSLDLVATSTVVPLYSAVDFILTLNNTGTITAHNVSVSFKLPAGFGLLSSNSSMGSYNSWLGIWTVDQVGPGASANVHLSAKLNIPNPAPFFAQVTAAQENDADSTPNNNAGPVPSEDDEAVVTVSSGSVGTSPTVVLSTPVSSVLGAFVVTTSFSEVVTGLSAVDFVVNNGTIASLSGSGSTYTMTVNPTVAGIVTVNLPANMANGASGLGNKASNILSVQYVNTPSGEYCTPHTIPWNDWISRVEFGTINNSSNKEGYADFTNLIAKVGTGSSQSITIGLGHGYWIYDRQYGVWIDFNHDKDFDDPGEMVLDAFVASSGNGTNPADFVGTIDIPSNALAGQTRMRVGLLRANAILSCGQEGFGEYEDYSVDIGDNTGTSGVYCTSKPTPWNDWIAKVELNTINNPSAKEGYGDFTYLQTELEKNKTHHISISMGHDYFVFDQYFRVWVDLNHDGDFVDANEMLVSKFVPSSGNGTNPPPIVEDLLIPDYALSGKTRMRVSMSRDGFGSVCNQEGFGEVEDYTIVVVDNGPTGSTDYCTSGATPWNEWIASVWINGMVHSSFKDGYGDFTDFVANVEKGVPGQIIINLGHGYWLYDEHYDVWVDLNQDGDFTDPGELLFSQQVTAMPNGSTPSPVFGTILIPTSAMNGETRLRVSLRRGDQPSTPCATTGLGEVEDYTINIQTPQNNLVYGHLLAFEAKELMGGVQTSWVLDNASATEYMVLEKVQIDEFESIAQFEYHQGNNKFDFWNAHPVIGMNYYRLKMVEPNGAVHFSVIKAVEILEKKVKETEIRLFPSISIGDFKMNLVGYEGLAAKIELVNTTGQVVKTWDFDEITQSLLSFHIEMKQGMYYVRVLAKGKPILVEKVILKK